MPRIDVMAFGRDDGQLSARQLRVNSDRVLFDHEFAVAYDEPVGDVWGESSDEHRGYLSIWVRGAGHDALYSCVQVYSGDDDMIRGWLAEMIDGGPSTIAAHVDDAEVLA